MYNKYKINIYRVGKDNTKNKYDLTPEFKISLFKEIDKEIPYITVNPSKVLLYLGENEIESNKYPSNTKVIVKSNVVWEIGSFPGIFNISIEDINENETALTIFLTEENTSLDDKFILILSSNDNSLVSQFLAELEIIRVGDREILYAKDGEDFITKDKETINILKNNE